MRVLKIVNTSIRKWLEKIRKKLGFVKSPQSNQHGACGLLSLAG